MIAHITFYLTQRFHFNELIAHLEECLTSSRFNNSFNIIQNYLRFRLALLRYNNSLKDHEATEIFNPNLNKFGLKLCLKFVAQIKDKVTLLSSLFAEIDQKKVRSISKLLSSRSRFDGGCTSVSSSEFESRIINSHNLVYVEIYWCVCECYEKSCDFRNFLLIPFSGELEFKGDEQYDQSYDTLWQTYLDIVIKA
tara:strand:- start:43 stop:627 length:585 start_codon:yes stop_codon:yes gene_type:complete